MAERPDRTPQEQLGFGIESTVLALSGIPVHAVQVGHPKPRFPVARDDPQNWPVLAGDVTIAANWSWAAPLSCG